MGIGFSAIWNGPSFLNRSASARRMAARDELKAREHFASHIHQDWDNDLWD